MSAAHLSRDRVDTEIARLGRELNDLRIDRRIYDYVVAML